MKTVVLSIIIVHYRTRELTLQCLRSIQEFSPRFSHEIILIDNGSQDEIGEKVAGEFPEVRLIETGRNDGFSRANNLGIVNARGQYMLLLNSDTKILEPVFDRLVQIMDSRPEVGCLGPQHVGGDGRHQVSYGKFPDLFTEILRKIVDYRIALNDLNIRGHLRELCSIEQEVDWLSGSCLLLRREALRQAGLFDESFFMYFEDIDLCKRIHERGWKIVFCPLSKILHYSGQSVKENILAGLVAYRQSQIYFARKHYGRRGDYIVRIVLFLKFGTIVARALLEFAAKKLLGRNTEAAYIKMLLSKKVFEMIFQRNRMRPVEPMLN
ncbi:MAG: glycosyltransferase family 2 protein [Candidatus Omnitrophota bacterium]